MHVLQIFIDGFGLGEADPRFNPIIAACTPVFDRLLGGHKLCGTEVVRTEQAILLPLEATLGYPGLPQSATGQTTLWTGVNAAEVAGGHIHAFPTLELREVIKQKSIMKALEESGYRATFANAFSAQYFDLVDKSKLKYSTSTLTALSGGIKLRDLEQLRAGQAVYQDITNEMLAERGEDIPTILPVTAGKNLAGIAREHDFTLYEYFQTDRAGHKQDLARGKALVELLDSFLGGVLEDLPLENTLVILTSDHGNLEDIRTKGHTVNPVPCLLIGNYQDTPYQGLKSIEHLAQFALDVVRGK